MIKKRLNISFILLLSLIISNPSWGLATQKKDPELWKKALKIHDEALVLDAHAHAVMGGFNPRKDLQLGKKTGKSQVDFITLKEGGVDGVFMAMPLRNEEDEDNPVKMILDSIEIIKKHVREYKTLGEIALSPKAVQKIHSSGKRAVLLSIESREQFGGRLETISEYYDRGIRSITLLNGSVDRLLAPRKGDSDRISLSEYGEKVIKEMNRVGLLIDITHCSDGLQREIIKASEAPVIASHSCVRALFDKPRNIPDSLIKAMAEKGGAVMITFANNHLSKEYAEKADKEGVIPPKVDIALLIDHIDHAVKTVGGDHVGLGSDFVGHINPVGLENASGFPLITYHLLERGYSEDNIKKILGGNLLRILEKVQKVSNLNNPG
jgi:membrane dipeptidase